MSILPFLKNKKFKNEKFINCLKIIYGLGYKKAILICTELKYDKNIKWKDINSKDLKKIDNIIIIKYGWKLNIELKNLKKKNITILSEIRSYKGTRHQYHLPVNGQNTHNNAKTNNLLWKKKH